MKKTLRKMFTKPDISFYEGKDSHLEPTLRTKDLIGLGVGMVVGAAIFTLPGIIAAEHTGPAVGLSFMIGAFGAWMIAMYYGEMASVMPYAGSAYTWVNILFGEFWGWLTGWALLAEYFLAMAFVASGWSAYLQHFIGSYGIELPKQISNSFNLSDGTWFNLLSMFAVLIVGFLLSRGTENTSRVENILVVLKIAVVIMFIVIGFTVIKPQNYVPFIPKHIPGTEFGGWQGIIAGTAQTFVAYVGFDALAANSAEAINPEKTMPRGIVGTLLIGVGFFVLVSTVLVGMFNYSEYKGNVEPSAWALRETGHALAANIMSVVAVFVMFTSLIAIQMAASRLIYSFGRDGMLPKFLGKLNKKHLPANALTAVTILVVIVGGILPFEFLTNLVSAGALVAFVTVALGMFVLRRREGKDLPMPQFKMPFFPVLPIASIIFSIVIFVSLGIQAQLLTLAWFTIGAIIYFAYGIKNSSLHRHNAYAKIEKELHEEDEQIKKTKK